MEPKVSILIPVYNIENYISRCLDSCLAQTLKDIEIICVNDGSTDSSLSILEEYAAKDERIRIITKNNGGLPSSRNVGMDNAKGEYVLYVDGDDYIEPDTCYALYSRAKANEATVIIFGGIVEPKEKRNDWINNTLRPEDKVYEDLSIDEFLHHSYMFPFLWRDFVLRSWIEENHFRLAEEVVIGEDLAFQFKILPLAKKVIATSEVYYHYDCSRAGSLTNNSKYSNVQYKINSHLFLLQHLHDDWKKRGIMQKYGNLFFDWAVDFLFWDFASLSPLDKPKVAKKIVSFLEEGLGIDEFACRIIKTTKDRFKLIQDWSGYVDYSSNKKLTLLLNIGLEPRKADFKNLLCELSRFGKEIQLEVFMHYYSPSQYIEFEKTCFEYDFVHFNMIGDYNEYQCFNDLLSKTKSPYVGFIRYEDVVPGSMDKVLSAMGKNPDLILGIDGEVRDPFFFAKIPLTGFMVRSDFLQDHDIVFRPFGTLASAAFKLDVFAKAKSIEYVGDFIVSTLERCWYKNEMKDKNEYLDYVLHLLDLYEKTGDGSYRKLAAELVNDGAFISHIVGDPFGWNELGAADVTDLFAKIVHIANSGLVYSSKSLSRLLLEFIRNRHTQMAGIKRSYQTAEKE